MGKFREDAEGDDVKGETTEEENVGEDEANSALARLYYTFPQPKQEKIEMSERSREGCIWVGSERKPKMHQGDKKDAGLLDHNNTEKENVNKKEMVIKPWQC